MSGTLPGVGVTGLIFVSQSPQILVTLARVAFFTALPMLVLVEEKLARVGTVALLVVVVGTCLIAA